MFARNFRRDVLLVLLCLTLLLGVADLLAPAGASAQGGTGTQTPGPCDDGWVAPTPTVITVTSVPITVSSTEDDYFVLYVKHDRGSGTVVNVPVSVTRGQSGNTSLSDSLASLGADKYRVEKYLVANPADIDGDCVDDITELDDFGYRNPTNPAMPVAAQYGFVGLEDHAAFEKLSYKGELVLADFWLKDLEYLKFNIVNINLDKPNIWFQDTNLLRSHWCFPLVGLEEVTNNCWGGTARGVLIYHPNVVAPDGSLGVYRWEFQPSDSFAFREVSIVHEVIAAAMPFLNDNLAYYPFVSPNAESKYELQQSLYDASRVNILLDSDILPDVDYVAYNVAEGYGLLSVFEPGETPGPRDVAILSVLPNDLPRAAGVITTVPQTPLSHVNLRAIQNGTPNAFIRDALTDQAVTNLVGSYVYYRTTADGFTLRVATKAEVDAHHAASRPQQTQTLQRDLTKTSITSLSNVNFADWTAFGVKAANVAELSGLTSLDDGVAPDGYAVPFYFYDEFMKQATVSKETILGKKKAPADEKITLPIGTTLASAVTQMLAHSKFQTDADTQEEMLDDLRKAIKNASSPDWIITALTTMHGNYPDGQSLRYRSSTNNEDLPDFNGAGLYDSKTQDPDETTADGIDKSIKAVWASLWNHHAFLERDFYRVDHTTVAMGVLVHPNYSDEKVNGVAISYDPVTSRDGYYYVNTQLGEDLVTNPKANSLPEEILLDPAGAATVLARSYLAPTNKLFMTDAQMIQLRDSLKAIHDHFETLYNPAVGYDFAMEIEFKITAQNKLAIKQARPWVFSQPLLATTPEISIVAGSDVTEGDNATFTLTASPKPVANINVTVEVTQSGDFVTTGSQTVTITPSGTATLTVPTGNESTEEADGSVTATISSGTGYSISNSNAAATVAIADDDTSSPCATRLTVDGTTQGEWTDSCKSSVQARGFARFFTFQISQQSDVTIDLTSSHDTYLYLRQGKDMLSGTSLHHNDDIGGGNYNSRIKRTLNPGWYTIEATTFHANRAGAFQMEINGLPAQASEPEIGIAAGTAITEGGDATFTVTATPRPSAELDVTVVVSQSGDYASTGTQTVTIPTTGSQTLTVSTTNDANDEPDGSVTATITTGTGYTVSSSANAATVAVSDDDAPALPEVSIAAGADITEGGSATFTVTASPPPNTQLTVSYTVSQSGDFGVSVTAGSVDIYSSGSSAIIITTANDDTSESDGSVSVTLSTSQNYTVSTSAGSATVAIADDDTCTPTLPADAITVAEVTGWRDEYSAATHQSRWNRVLEALGEDTGSGESPMTAAQARDIKSQIDNSRWDRTVRTLEVLAQCDTPPPAKPEISIAAGNAVTEGTVATFTVTATPAPSSDLDVTVEVSQSGDYASTGSRTVTITTSGSATLTVSTTDDTTDEADGSVTATISVGTGYTVSSNGGAATIAVSDDDVPEISIAAGPGVTEGTAASFTLTASPTPAVDLDITIAVSQSGDYVTTGTRTVTIPTSGSKTFTVATTDDTDDEPDGSVTASINSGTGYTVSTSSSTATVAISDDDTCAPTLPDDAVTVSEVTAWRDQFSHSDHVLRWNRVLTALGQDTGETAMTVSEAQTHYNQYSNTRWERTLRTLQALEQCDTLPPVPQISIVAGNAVTEGSDATFTVTASPAPTTALTVNLAVSQSGSFGATTGADTVTIPTTGSTTYTVSTTNDSTDEPNGSVTATLSTGTGYSVSSTNDAATVAVSDDDDPLPATPVISIAAGSGVTEGSDATFTVTASPTPTTPLTVNLTVSQSGSFGATTGADTVTIPTSGSATFTVSTTNDNSDEPDGSVTATLSTGTGYTVSGVSNAATVAVSDDDDPPPATPTISIIAGSGITEGANASFTVTASPTPTSALTVNVTISQSGSFASTGARTVTIPTSGSLTFTVSTTNDNTDEANGSVTATLNTGTGYTVSGTSNAATVAVSDDDDAPLPPPSTGTPTVTVSDASANEGDGHLRFTVTLSHANSETIKFRYGAFDRSATAGRDFTTEYKEFTLSAGDTTLDIDMPIIDDSEVEGDETLNVFVYATSGITIAPYFTYADGTIVDDDH